MGEVTNQGLQQGEFDLTQFYSVFFEEAGENLANMESLLLEIDLGQPSDEDLNAVFRVAHSIKGGAATFGFADVTTLTHELETLLERVRRRELALDSGMVDVLLEAGDVVRAQLARHQGRSSEIPETSELIGRIRILASGAALEPVAATATEAVAALPVGTRRLRVRVGPLKEESVADDLAELFRDIPSLGTIEASDGGALGADGYRRFLVTTTSPDSELVELFSFHVARDQILIEPDAASAEPSAAAVAAAMAAAADARDDANGFGFFVDPRTLRPAAARAAAAAANRAGASGKVPEPKARSEKTGAGNLDSNTLRVSVERVDQLINLVGELVITQAMLTQQVKDLDPAQFRPLLTGVTDLERNTRHLQEAVMSIRMIPMSFVFNRFPRMIRDLAVKLDKKIELKMVGEATELDKGLIEKIIDPLTHLVRNSADHGLETPDKRLAAGKSETGTITLLASHQGGSILIEVRDDGQGLRRDRILAKARERGFPVRDDMTDAEVWALIWEAGFSTADQLSDVSGRGVGMDVVRRNITELGGTVELDSAEGLGMRVCVRLPLTLAIMDGMSIGVGDETYILPLASVIESFQIEPGMVQTVGSNGRVVKVRNEYMPVVALADEFRVPRLAADQGGKDGPEILVIVEADGKRLAAIVDELLGQHQVVVKNLESNYRRVRDISGATILGDGRVALIIDVSSLVKRARH
ncbi:fused chemotactic sensory histidine kinase in two-component regulatory system with CheB and CheY: sensory histidine kinase; signal sensing protein [Burkholderiales bacterium]|jgi:two-component system chemotaxis sensor kinase CheA|nr:fused chemotactic sensory histidine kinase in two-component regulatory system with CheB and CheY: sensory histidine kinase; signal sensing protein [Burkholderiales bacterium]